MSATKAGDIQIVLNLMSDDVVFLVPGHPPMIGKAAFAAAAQAQSNQPVPQFDGASEIQEIEVLGDWRSCRRNSRGGHTAYRRSADQGTRGIRLYDSTIQRSDRTEMRAGKPYT